MPTTRPRRPHPTMRGLSFSATARRRSTDRLSAHTTSSSTHTPPSPAQLPRAPPPKSLIKRLSTTLRRRVSPPLPPASVALPTAVLSPTTSSPPSSPTLSDSPSLAQAPRARTFAVGEEAPVREVPARDIPFFADGARPDRAPRASRPIAVVRGRPPAWVADEPPPGVLREANRQPARSFSADPDSTPTRPPPTPRARSMSAPSAPPSDAVRKARRQASQRWPLPPGEQVDTPRLFAPPPGTPLDRVTARRDRTEARALVSACTFLEAEVRRMRGAVEKGSLDNGPCVCKKVDGGGCEGCEGAATGFVRESAHRLLGVLGILEDRIESIEQVYLKSEEYAIAMGNFFEVSPHVINKLAAGHRDLAGKGEKKQAVR